MLKQPFCTYCGMEGHLAAACTWKTSLIQCDDGIHLIDLRKGFSDFYGWVLRRHPDGLLVSVRKATAAEIVTASLRAAAISLRERTADAAPADAPRASIDVATKRFEGPAMHWAPDQSERSLGMVEPKQAEGAQGELELFEAWWATSGLTKFKDTAQAAWEARATLAQPSPTAPSSVETPEARRFFVVLAPNGDPADDVPPQLDEQSALDLADDLNKELPPHHDGLPYSVAAALIGQPSPAPAHADIPRFVWGEDGMHRASSGTWIRDAWLRAIEEQHDRIAGALRVELKSATQDKTSTLMLLSTMRKERDAAQATLAELEKQEPFYYFADCDDPDYSRLYNTEGDAISQISDHGGDVVKLYASPVAQAGQAPQAWLDVQAERRRQVEVEGFDAGYDNMATRGQIARAASCYALHAGGIGTDWPDGIRNGSALFWPWDKEWWKPRTARDNLVRAGALVLAEIERLDRSAGRQPEGCSKAPAGWTCTRSAGHEGPCAAAPTAGGE